MSLAAQLQAFGPTYHDRADFIVTTLEDGGYVCPYEAARVTRAARRALCASAAILDRSGDPHPTIRRRALYAYQSAALALQSLYWASRCSHYATDWWVQAIRDVRDCGGSRGCPCGCNGPPLERALGSIIWPVGGSMLLENGEWIKVGVVGDIQLHDGDYVVYSCSCLGPCSHGSDYSSCSVAVVPAYAGPLHPT